MKKTKKDIDPELIREELVQLFQEFSQLLKSGDLRPKVLHLVKAFQKLRALGTSISLNEFEEASSARRRIIEYLKRYVNHWISGDEIMVVSGIQDYPRRIRELRVEFGWQILSGLSFNEMSGIEGGISEEANPIKPDTYILTSLDQDREAAYRWKLANEIRKLKGIGTKDKILRFLQENIGKPVSGDELRYVAGNATEWARRVRELRTEDAWPIVTFNTGRRDLLTGEYVLEENRQGQIHDRKIPDSVRIEVLMRDFYSCQKCGWNRELLAPGDPRKLLELHHIVAHIKKGENTTENLITLCNVCHDLIHKDDRENIWVHDDIKRWLGK